MRVNWEVEVPGIKSLESLKVWEDIYGALHLFGQPDHESRERAEDMEAVWLHKVEYSIKAIEPHTRERLCGSCRDCSHKWLKEAAKVTAAAQMEQREVFQRWHSLKSLAFSGSWK